MALSHNSFIIALQKSIHSSIVTLSAISLSSTSSSTIAGAGFTGIVCCTTGFVVTCVGVF
jgi:hypothetical protein